jgi:FAD/FMN-containing dehydrogenase
MTAATAPWVRLHDQLAGEVLLPGEAGYGPARELFLAQYDEIRPAVVVRCRSSSDVAAPVRLAAACGLAVVPRSGGHSLAGYSTGEGVVVVDVGQLTSVTLAGPVAQVCPGVRAGALNHVLAGYGRMLPVGANPWVGVAGLTLGGGLGYVGRAYGYTCDHLTGAEVVLADGQILCCDRDRDPRSVLGAARCGQRAVRGGDPAVVRDPRRLRHRQLRSELAAGTRGTGDPGVARLAGSGTRRDVRIPMPDRPRATGRRAARRGVRRVRRHPVGGRRAARRSGVPGRCAAVPPMAPGVATAADHRLLGQRSATRSGAATGAAPGWRATRSECFRTTLPDPAVRELVAPFTAGEQPGAHRSVEFTHLGGGYAALRPEAAALAHRDERYTVKHSVELSVTFGNAARARAKHWVDLSWAALRPYGSRAVYPNFPDPDLESWDEEYYGSGLARLRGIKRRYGPGNVFRFDQSIVPGEPPCERPGTDVTMRGCHAPFSHDLGDVDLKLSFHTGDSHAAQ